MNVDLASASPGAAIDARNALVQSTRNAGEHEMAATARQALFTEALLGALKARVDEFKTAAK